MIASVTITKRTYSEALSV